MEPEEKKKIMMWSAVGAGVCLLGAACWLLLFMSQFTEYRDKANGFSVKYPSKWQKVIAPQPGAAVVFVTAKETALDVFQENVSITIQEGGDETSNIKNFTDTMIKQMKTVFENIRVLQTTPITFAGRSGHEIIFAADKPEAVRIHIVVTMKGSSAYILTYMSMATRYEQYLPLVKEMIKSFRFRL